MKRIANRTFSRQAVATLAAVLSCTMTIMVGSEMCIRDR